MKLVDSSFVTDDEQAVRALLESHPREAYTLYRLFNAYHELVSLCVALMHNGETDTADVLRSHAKKEQALIRLGIPLWHTLDDWTHAQEQQKTLP